MLNSFRSGQRVGWKWGSGTAEGRVTEKFERRVQCTFKGSRGVKKGMGENPAYLIEQEDGGYELKCVLEYMED